MAKNKMKKKSRRTPIEKHDNAAWANIENLLPESQVPIPSFEQVKNAKEWVDSNQK